MEKMLDRNQEEITGKEIYSAIIHLIIHAESITWNRFYNFLMGNSILILAWTMVFASQTKCLLVTFVLVIICIFGGLGAPFWAFLGIRGREYLEKYISLAVKIENSDYWPTYMQDCKTLSITKEMGDRTLPGRWASSYKILKYCPWAFTFFYILLLFASFFR